MAEQATFTDYLTLLTIPNVEQSNAAPKQESGMKLRIIYAVDDPSSVLAQFVTHGFETNC